MVASDKRTLPAMWECASDLPEQAFLMRVVLTDPSGKVKFDNTLGAAIMHLALLMRAKEQADG